MSFDFNKFKQIALFVTPLVLPAFGVDPALTNLIVHGVTLAEDAANGSPKTGAQKKALALEAVQTGLQIVNQAKPGAVDVDQASTAVSDSIDAVIKAINLAKNIPVKAAGTTTTL